MMFDWNEPQLDVTAVSPTDDMKRQCSSRDDVMPLCIDGTDVRVVTHDDALLIPSTSPPAAVARLFAYTMTDPPGQLINQPASLYGLFDRVHRQRYPLI